MQGSETAIIQASYACDRGSSPLPAPMRMYVNGRLSALQADDAGSIPVVRSNRCMGVAKKLPPVSEAGEAVNILLAQHKTNSCKHEIQVAI